MKKQNPHTKAGNFKVPEGYFKSFEDRLFEKIEAPDTLPGDDGFTVPKDYFEGFEDRLLQRVHREKTSKVVWLQAYKTLYYTLAAAAAVLVLFIGIRGFILDPGTSVTVSSADVEVYINNGYMALNSYDIAEVFKEEALEITNITEHGIDSEKLVDYLYENLDSYDDLATED